jgi:lipopolysaccharide transport system permease protein
MIRSLLRHRSLIFSLSRREVLGRYQGSVLGIFWSLVLPIFMLTVYTFVFSVIFRARWSAQNESRTEFALILFAGLLVFNLFAECVNKAPSLVLQNPNYVKKVVFPLEILPWISFGSALFHTAISYLVWQVFYCVIFGWPPVTFLLFPVVLLPLAFFIMGLSWALAALAVYIRDVTQLVGVATAVLMFLSPIFYPATALPVAYRGFLILNPVAQPIEYARGVLLWAQVPSLVPFCIMTLVSAIFAWLGFVIFQKLRPGFSDVL